MDFNHICSQKGYRYEDLTPENQNVIDWCKHLAGELDTFAENTIEDGGAPLHERVYNSIARETVECAKEWLETTILEIQVSLAENQPEGQV